MFKMLSAATQRRFQRSLSVTRFIRRFIASCLLVAFAAACSTPSSNPIDTPIAAEHDFRTADLFFLELNDEGIIHRFDTDVVAAASSLRVLSPGLLTFSLASGHAHDGLYAAAVDTTSGATSVRRLGGTDDVLYEGDLYACLSSGHEPELPVALSRPGENERNDGPTTSTWFEIGTSGLVEVRTFPPRVFCPVRGPQPAMWAVGEDVEMTEKWNVELAVQTADGEGKIRWPDCVLMPMDFTSDGERLAMGATCDDHSRSGLYIVDVSTLETTDEPLVPGVVGAGRWSPSNRLIAFAHLSSDAYESTRNAPTTVNIFRPSDGALETVTTDNTSWPAWVLRETADSGSSAP